MITNDTIDTIVGVLLSMMSRKIINYKAYIYTHHHASVYGWCFQGDKQLLILTDVH